MAKRRVGVEYSPSYAGAHAPKGGVTRPTGRCAFLPTFSHFLIVNKTSLSLSPCLPLQTRTKHTRSHKPHPMRKVDEHQRYDPHCRKPAHRRWAAPGGRPWAVGWASSGRRPPTAAREPPAVQATSRSANTSLPPSLPPSLCPRSSTPRTSMQRCTRAAEPSTYHDVGGLSLKNLSNMGTESTPGEGPHQAEHTHRHQTAGFRSGETCPEAGSKRTLPSDKPGPFPLRTGLL
jgi:hypothetical protein